MKISRRVVGNDGSVRKEEKVLTINVKPGERSLSQNVAVPILSNVAFVLIDKLGNSNIEMFIGEEEVNCRTSLVSTADQVEVSMNS
jgi:hypothetical protein